MIASLIIIAILILYWCSLGSDDPEIRAIGKKYGPKGGRKIYLLNEKDAEIAKQKWVRRQKRIEQSRTLQRKINNNKRRL